MFSTSARRIVTAVAQRTHATYTPTTLRPATLLDTYGTRRPMRTLARHLVEEQAPLSAAPNALKWTNSNSGLSVAEAITVQQRRLATKDSAVFLEDFLVM